MLHTLKSESLTVAVSSVGAELQSILSNESGTEYLWQGDPKWWGSRAPVLFPLIGMSADGKYICGGKEYPAPRHGLVRSAYFHLADEVAENNADAGENTDAGENADAGENTDAARKSITLEYVDNPGTRAVYPFKFTFQVKFELDGNALAVSYRAVNQSGAAMPFCLGAHEAYNCAGFTNHYLEFEREDDLLSETMNLSTWLLTGARYRVKKDGNVLPLIYSLFDNDTLIFKSIASRKVSLKSKTSAAAVEVTYDAPNLAVWTKPGAPYICIEPWHGLPGAENGSRVLAERPGAVTLPPGGEFISKHVIKVTG